MPMPQPKTIDPLHRFREGVRAFVRGDERPVPLASTAISVDIRGGIAAVTTARTFRNVESQDIEPIMTFPVPVDAVLCSLKAKIDGREFVAVAEAKAKARETYEDAVDRGKSAVLHEELMKGVHMLNVGRVAHGAEVVVTATFVAPLSFVGDAPGVRIPTTIGEIFGRSPLLDSDEIAVSDREHHASLTVACDSGTAVLLGGAWPKKGVFDVVLNAPIDIAVTGWKQKEVRGVAADGREVVLRVEPVGKVDAALEVDVVVDNSGSMNDRAEGGVETRHSKFELATAGLHGYAGAHVGNADRVRAWEFNGSVHFVGEATGSAVAVLLGRLQPPSGGTELGVALDAVAAREGSRNVVLLTDGKTWAFDPQKYARSGMRVTAVLIGEDALDGRVSHLAGLTGGQVFAPLGSDVPAAVAAALDAARAPFEQAPAIEGKPRKIAAVRRGARVEAEWSAKATETKASEADRQVGALAAYLALASMTEDAAAALASEEGIVFHLTSLVLVDEAAETRTGVPATRKVALTVPLTAMMHAAPVAGAVLQGASLSDFLSREVQGFASSLRVDRPVSLRERLSDFFDDRSLGTDFDLQVPSNPLDTAAHDRSLVVAALALLPKSIDWDAAPDDLRKGDLSSLSQETADAIRKAAALPDIVAAALGAGLDPVVFVVALLARAAGSGSRTASRIARAAFGTAPAAGVAIAARAIGL